MEYVRKEKKEWVVAVALLSLIACSDKNLKGSLKQEELPVIGSGADEECKALLNADNAYCAENVSSSQCAVCEIEEQPVPSSEGVGMNWLEKTFALKSAIASSEGAPPSSPPPPSPIKNVSSGDPKEIKSGEGSSSEVAPPASGSSVRGRHNAGDYCFRLSSSQSTQTASCPRITEDTRRSNSRAGSEVSPLSPSPLEVGLRRAADVRLAGSACVYLHGGRQLSSCQRIAAGQKFRVRIRGQKSGGGSGGVVPATND